MSISVIIPVYNTSPWLSECIDSVLAVTNGLSLEIILVDDESTDHSRDILQSYAAKHVNITTLFQTHGRQGKARNTGLAHASGKYVLFLDSDDKLHGNTLVNFYQEAEEHGSDFVVGLARSFSGHNSWINEGYAAYEKAVACTKLDTFPQLLSDPSACNKLYRRTFLNKHIIRFPENSYCEDVYFSYKASLLAERVTILPEILHEYRGRDFRHIPSGTQTFTPDRVIQCARIYRSCIEEYRDNKPALNSLLEDRTVIRFMRFFSRIRHYPDADAQLYRELQLLFLQLSTRSIALHGDRFAVPFCMIRKSCFRHAVAVLNNLDNTIAINDFIELIHNEKDRELTPLLDLAAKKRTIQSPSKNLQKRFSSSVRFHGIPLQLKYPGVLNDTLMSIRSHNRIKRLRFAAERAMRFWAFPKKHKIVLIKDLSIALLLKILLHIFRPLVRVFIGKRVWLIAERGGRGAEESGYVFFKYCLNTKKLKDVYYILNKDTSLPLDFPDHTKAIRKQSWQYFPLLCLADTLIFTNSVKDICPCNIPGWPDNAVQTVFLNHGVTLYGPGVSLRKKANQFGKIIAISEHERQQKIRDWEIKASNRIIITGLPRFDELHGHQSDKEILFCLTWRKRLDVLNPEEFKNSLYYNAILSFLEHPGLAGFLSDNDMRLRLRFHFRMKEHAPVFDRHASKRVLVEYSDSVAPLRNVLQKAAVLITDYSSILWDMAYMERPVLLYQFDVDAFLAERGLHGFSTKEESMEFATVVRNQEELLSALKDLSKREFILDAEQKQNARSFFQFHDKKNCERVFQMIEQRK